jgi:hypothetical protein
VIGSANVSDSECGYTTGERFEQEICKVRGKSAFLGKTGFQSETIYPNYGNYGSFYNDRGHVASDVGKDIIRDDVCR